ncbi:MULTISPECIES: hypothetical protein [Burkholderia]|uniref:hypothetical protein n=1 Tax=Burkholderia TaxID=32008 RepID=UPI001CF19111|nr:MULTISPECIES: hypothetical protein [Burkholderia]MCA8198629.1 hypothetical protein [Burkholderia vietnamiensis]MCS6479735.1 hypothetical protein [Burkholderia thailandensis]MDN7819784.1 hypothetical protein [Burkholderia vietnamiensis]
MRYAMRKAFTRLLLLEAVHPVFLCMVAYFVLDDFTLPHFVAELGSLYGAFKLMHVAYVMAALAKLGVKNRTILYTLSLSALVAALCPFLLFWMSGQFYREPSIDDLLYSMQLKDPGCYHMSWFFAAVILFVGLVAAIGGQGSGRKIEFSDDSRGPGLPEINTNGAPMTSPGSGIDVTGHVLGDTSI